MKIKISKKILDYYGNSRNLVVKVNHMSNYLNLKAMLGIDYKLSFSLNDLVETEIDESEIDDENLKNPNIFSLIAIYILAVGE